MSDVLLLYIVVLTCVGSKTVLQIGTTQADFVSVTETVFFSECDVVTFVFPAAHIRHDAVSTRCLNIIFYLTKRIIRGVFIRPKDTLQI